MNRVLLPTSKSDESQKNKDPMKSSRSQALEHAGCRLVADAGSARARLDHCGGSARATPARGGLPGAASSGAERPLVGSTGEAPPLGASVGQRAARPWIPALVPSGEARPEYTSFLVAIHRHFFAFGSTRNPCGPGSALRPSIRHGLLTGLWALGEDFAITPPRIAPLSPDRFPTPGRARSDRRCRRRDRAAPRTGSHSRELSCLRNEAVFNPTV
jgi:hypothetical protein